MAELRQALQTLVEHPPAPPVAVEVVAARGAHFHRRRRVLRSVTGLALVAFASAVGLGIARQDVDRSLGLAAEGPRTAGYIAEKPGGYVATGIWRVTITREGQVIELSSTTSEPCGRIGIIQPGDEVRGSISGQGATLRVGEIFSCPG
jgi:hypothetical protein